MSQAYYVELKCIASYGLPAFSPKNACLGLHAAEKAGDDFELCGISSGNNACVHRH